MAGFMVWAKESYCVFFGIRYKVAHLPRRALPSLERPRLQGEGRIQPTQHRAPVGHAHAIATNASWEDLLQGSCFWNTALQNAYQSEESLPN
jgi:hypothetical protein